MYNSYFNVYDHDADFYNRYLKDRLPDTILDAHVHMNLPEHVAHVSEETIKKDWALQYSRIMPYDEACEITGRMFPDKEYRMLAFSWPLRDADITANNTYLGVLASAGKIDALLTVRSEWDVEYCERALLRGGFLGFKPYPYMASPIKDGEVSIFDCIPKEQLKVLNKHKKALLLHIPRRGRLQDEDNIREIRSIIQGFPDITVILAHFGRCFSLEQFTEGMQKLGEDRYSVYFDTAGVAEYGVYRAALDTLDLKRILYGTDMPVFLWHGRIEWSKTGVLLYTRENFNWNGHLEGPEKEKAYTFYMYDQLNNLLNALGSSGAAKQDIEAVFLHNAKKAYKII